MPCDASGMVEIHRYYKQSFGEGGRLVSGVADGDVAHAELVGAHLDVVSRALHAHREFEDSRVWDPLTQAAPACALHVGRMKQQHAQMLVHLNALDAALPAWRASGNREDAVAVLAALDGINAALTVHLPDEETNIVPVMEDVFEQRLMTEAAEHGRKATPKGYTWPMLSDILRAQPDGGDVWLRKSLPLPVQWLWKAVGRRRYQGYRRSLEGADAR